MAFDTSLFRTQYPEFTDPVKYTDEMIGYWSGEAQCDISEEIFDCAYTRAVSLYTAHYITLQANAIAESNSGNVPTGDAGLASSKQVGPVEIEYDTVSSAVAGGGLFNSTWYGRQYLAVRAMYAQGGYFIGGFVC